MHHRPSIKFVLVASLLLTSCKESAKLSDSMISSCEGPIFLPEYQKIRRSDYPLVKNAIGYIFQGDTIGEVDKYCQIISKNSDRYCVLFYLKDHSVGGDIEACFNYKDGKSLGVKYGE
jgi:hypothetical protein